MAAPDLVNYTPDRDGTFIKLSDNSGPYTWTGTMMVLAGGSSSDPARSAVAVVLSDVTVIAATRALYVGVGGTIKVRMASDGVDCTFVNVAAGIFPLQVDKVYSSVTTASSIVALY